MAGELTLRIITPEKIALDTVADSVRVPAADGSMGILKRHAPMVAALDSGLLRFKADGQETVMFVAGGFAEVRSNTVRVVTEAGERAQEIDVERALAAEKRARERLAARTSPGRDPVDLLRAEASLRRAIMRIRAKRGA